jgi:hypothetical protein
MPSTDAEEDPFGLLESGAKIKVDKNGEHLATIRFVARREPDYWRNVEMSSPFLPVRRFYLDSRKSEDDPDLFRPWAAYLKEAEAERAAVLAGKAAPIAAPSSKAAPVASEAVSADDLQLRIRQKRGEEMDYWAPEPAAPSKPMSVVEVQRLLRRKG